MAFTEIDGDRQIQDLTVGKNKIKSDFLEGANLDLTGGNNNATLTGLANGVEVDDAVNKGQMDAAIAAAISGGMVYKGQIDAGAVGTTLDNASAGEFWYVSGAGVYDGHDFQIGDHLVVNQDITGAPVGGETDKIDNTESDDILRDADIIDDLTTGGTDKVLSAQQGVVLKGFIDGLQTELDDTQTGAGLGSDGSYTANGGANYISGATSLKNADDLLDAQVKVNADNISQNASDIVDLQAHVSERVFGEEPAITVGLANLAPLVNIPVNSGTARVYLNGIRQRVGASNDYQINEATGVITFGFTMKAKDVVLVDYEY